ncbi:CAP domain-containing protein [Haloarcula sp. S1AR25-5A]|uniref:CAP domain-containing protein n=1 Tax=Haloarcula terrestris TaxID=2950533 RepID=A0AAE4EV95_9EURY|nr:CAP domain-containing protein [Haloarcula terrestris]MDS0220770.1 CAP domain-containing protein [Haloarcula terrestris]
MNRSGISLGLVVLAAISVSLLAGMAVAGTVGTSPSEPAPAVTTDRPPAATPSMDSASPATPSAESASPAMPRSKGTETGATQPQSANPVSTPERGQTTPEDTEPPLDTDRLEGALVAAINDRRGDPLANDAVDETLSTETTTGQTLSAMAGNHSERMAAQRLASPIANGSDTRDRYAAAGLSDRCRLRHVENTYIRPVTDLELVTSINPNGANATRTADAVADHWFDLSGPRDTLYMPNANHIGVGAATADGVVYITVNLC